MKNPFSSQLRNFFQKQNVVPQVPLSIRLRVTLRRWLHGLGWSGLLSLAVLASTPALYFYIIHSAQERLDATRNKVIILHNQLTPVGNARHNKVDTPAEQLVAFYKKFPDERSSPEWLEKLVVMAQSHGLSLNEGEYKVTREKVGRLLRFHMTLPMKGEYPQIRKFLAALPSELPVVALENVQFERQKVADPIVEVRIKLILFLEQAP
ncbi:MAG: type 4a pilus biogenesis protein PilO [bacterium]